MKAVAEPNLRLEVMVFAVNRVKTPVALVVWTDSGNANFVEISQVFWPRVADCLQPVHRTRAIRVNWKGNRVVAFLDRDRSFRELANQLALLDFLRRRLLDSNWYRRHTETLGDYEVYYLFCDVRSLPDAQEQLAGEAGLRLVNLLAASSTPDKEVGKVYGKVRFGQFEVVPLVRIGPASGPGTK